MNLISHYLTPLPLVAILRGITPQEATPITDILFEVGFRIIEVPLNSPQPFDSIAAISKSVGSDALVGAGTVLTSDNVTRVRDAGGELIVMPHGDVTIIRAAKQQNMICTPGIATPTEGVAALAAGADGLKLFPAEMLTPKILKALRAVFAKDTVMIPVGGITPEAMADFWRAGATGFGVGSALYRPGMTPAEVRTTAQTFIQAFHALPQRTQ